MTHFLSEKLQNSQLFTKDTFLSFENDSYGNSFFQLKLSDYSKLFQALNLVGVGFGRKHFENDQKNWCRWTFDINGIPTDLYSSSFDGAIDSYPTFVIDFCEHSSFSALQILFERMNNVDKENFSFLKNANEFQSDTIRSLFNNFLKTSILNRTVSNFNDSFQITDIICLDWSSESVSFDFLLNKKNAKIYFNHYALLSLTNSEGGGNPYLSFEEEFQSFESSLYALNFYPDDLSKALCRNLFILHCKNEVFHQFRVSEEFVLKNMFEPLPEILSP